MEEISYPRLGTGKILKRNSDLIGKRIAMVGLGQSVAEFPGFYFYNKDKIAQVWTINMACLSIRSDLNFSCHALRTMEGHEDPAWTDEFVRKDVEKFEAHIESNKKLVKYLSESPVPQVTLDGSYNSFEYPLAEIVEAFNDSYFMNGFAYMIAYAMWCSVSEIDLFGCEFEITNAGYEQGRCSVEWWIAKATSRGVYIITPFTDLLDLKKRKEMGLYGYGYQQPIFGSNGKVISFRRDYSKLSSETNLGR